MEAILSGAEMLITHLAVVCCSEGALYLSFLLSLPCPGKPAGKSWGPCTRESVNSWPSQGAGGMSHPEHAHSEQKQQLLFKTRPIPWSIAGDLKKKKSDVTRRSEKPKAGDMNVPRLNFPATKTTELDIKGEFCPWHGGPSAVGLTVS